MPLEAATIAEKLGAKLEYVEASWPLIQAALDEFGIRSDLVEIAAAATIGVECPSWTPVRELHANPTRQPELWAVQNKYWPSGFYGRGFIQTTWKDNYAKLGAALGLDLVADPDQLLDPKTSARALAFFFKTHGVAAHADAQDWRGVRLRVNGGYNGWDLFNHYTGLLLEVIGA